MCENMFVKTKCVCAKMDAVVALVFGLDALSIQSLKLFFLASELVTIGFPLGVHYNGITLTGHP